MNEEMDTWIVASQQPIALDPRAVHEDSYESKGPTEL